LVDCQPTGDRVSIGCRSSIDRLSIATSTDIVVDIAVDITYSKCDPKDGLVHPQLCKNLSNPRVM